MGKKNSDFEILKKHYGEDFAKFCRANFSNILEVEGLLPKTIEENFAPSKSLYEDIVSQGQEQSFVSYIYSLLPELNEEFPEVKVKETPEELMKKAGYTLYKCKTNADVLKFKKYYKEDEEICTFRDPYRIKGYHIFFAVKDDVEEIKRENFANPQRQDKYGTSVISIQFNKASGYISIKNRYNHTVKNPDATFGNNLENIAYGLTNSFARHYNISLKNSVDPLELDGYTPSYNGIWHKYNLEINNVYYCENNIIIINDRVLQFDKNRYILIDKFLIDKEKKTIINLSRFCIETKSDEDEVNLTSEADFNLVYSNLDKSWYDSFVELYKKIEKIEVTKGKNGERLITITTDGNKSYITIDKCNRIIKYENNFVEKIENSFLSDAEYLKSFTAKNLIEIGNGFCIHTKGLRHFNAPNLEIIGDSFLYHSNTVNIRLPKVKKIGFNFISGGETLKSISAPVLESVGNNFLQDNTSLERIYFPNLEWIGSYFLSENEEIIEVNLPKLKETSRNFLSNATHIKKLFLPEIIHINDDFMRFNSLEQIYIPKVSFIGDNFLSDGSLLKELTLPNCEYIGRCFLQDNASLEKFIAPKLIEVDRFFMAENKSLRTVALPQLEKVGYGFLNKNKRIKELIAPKLSYNLAKKYSNRKIAHLIKRQIKLKKKEEDKQK